MRQHAGISPLPRHAHLAAGAQEVWLAYEDGEIRYIDGAGEKPRSAFPITVALPDLTKGHP
jgi:hypothetical protein